MQASSQRRVDRVWPRGGERAYLRATTLALAGTLALAISAKIQVPFYPVPMTLQTLAVLVLGAAFGPRLAAATVALYLAEGLAGLPVFAGDLAGPAYVVGPTGGFLVGFLPAAYLVGLLVERGWAKGLLAMAAVMAVGHAVIFALGWSWLAMAVGPVKAYLFGVEPFYLATLLKTALAAALIASAGRSLRGGLA